MNGQDSHRQTPRVVFRKAKTNSRSKETEAGKFKAHSRCIRWGESADRDWKRSWNPNGRNLEQEEEEFILNFINQGAALTKSEVKCVTSITAEFGRGDSSVKETGERLNEGNRLCRWLREWTRGAGRVHGFRSDLPRDICLAWQWCTRQPLRLQSKTRAKIPSQGWIHVQLGTSERQVGKTEKHPGPGSSGLTLVLPRIS